MQRANPDPTDPSAPLALPRLLGTSAVRIALAAMALIMLAATLIGGAIYWRTTGLLARQVVATLEAEARGLREQFQAGGLEQLAETVNERARMPGASLYLLADASGRKLAGNLSRLPLQLAATPDIFHYLGPASDGRSAERQAFGLAIAVPGGARLVVGRDVEDQRRFASEARWALLGGIAALSLASLGAGLWAGRRLLRRVETITATSRAIMAGDMGERVAVDGSGDEMDQLAESLNVMLARIEQLMAGLKEVSDNIAHDLKTPLNRLRNRAEAALRSSAAPSAHREALAEIIEQADDLINTFNALLSIARLEAGAMPEGLAAIDLGAVVTDVAELYEPVAEEAGMGLVAEIEAGVVVRANRQLVGQVTANLVDNALKYATAGTTPPAGPIRVAVRRAGALAELIVADSGPGIPAADRERVLGRFVRLEASRTRPGTGLGLSLVAAVARLHGGSVRLEDNAPGLRVVLSLPAATVESRAAPAAAAAPTAARREA